MTTWVLGLMAEGLDVVARRLFFLFLVGAADTMHSI